MPLTLKDTGEIKMCLGCTCFRDQEGALCSSARAHIKRMMEAHERMFGSKPIKRATSPLASGDHPELDDAELLGPEDTAKCQSLIGALQWAVSLGRADIATAVMTMSSFRALPREGHLERVKRIYGCLRRMDQDLIRINTDEPDYSDLPDPGYDWTRSVYGEVYEVIPSDAPEPKGKRVTQTSYVDANLMHCLMTGKSVTGCLHFLNKTLIDAYTKKQGTVETATYSSEFVAARTCVEQAEDIRTTLRYLGVPVHSEVYLFGDNESVVTSSTIPHSALKKRHNILSCHRVREAIASGVHKFTHMLGEGNPADVVSKHWGYQQVWPVLRQLLFNPDGRHTATSNPEEGE